MVNSTATTPQKINMEPKNHTIEKENHLNQTIIFRFYVNLPGCNLRWDTKALAKNRCKVHPLEPGKHQGAIQKLVLLTKTKELTKEFLFWFNGSDHMTTYHP